MSFPSLDTTVIVTTYNWPQALRLTLRSIRGQSVTPGEVVVADDGSNSETARVVKEVLGPTRLTWCHVWHEDKGVRQSRIKNLAVRHSGNPYLIFVDQDVVLHTDFIADHLAMTRKNCFLQGKRSLLPAYYTREQISEGIFRPPSFLLRGLGNRKNTLRLPLLGMLFSRTKRFQTSLRGCNLSMFRTDFLGVDGFDEVFDTSWGREDSDICYRLFHRGVRIRNLWFSALQYHLKHAVVKTWQKERLDRELRKSVIEKRREAVEGFSRLSPEGGVIASSLGYTYD